MESKDRIIEREKKYSESIIGYMRKEEGTENWSLVVDCNLVNICLCARICDWNDIKDTFCMAAANALIPHENLWAHT